MHDIAITPVSHTARVSAWFIDCAITIALMMGMTYWGTGTLNLEQFTLQADYVDLAVLIGVPLTFHIIVQGLLMGSLGMYLLDIQLLQIDGELPTWSNAWLRPLALLVLIPTAFLPALLLCLNDQRRGLADIISATRVVESLALGRRIMYDPWRLFAAATKILIPVGVVLALAALLLIQDKESNKEIVLDAVLFGSVVPLLLALLIAGIKVKTSRVRISSRGIQRSGWFGWSRKLVAWHDIDHARIRARRLLPYFEVHRRNRRRFKVPIEHHVSQYTADAFTANGVSIEP